MTIRGGVVGVPGSVTTWTPGSGSRSADAGPNHRTTPVASVTLAHHRCASQSGSGRLVTVNTLPKALTVPESSMVVVSPSYTSTSASNAESLPSTRTSTSAVASVTVGVMYA